jgi:hypothetical protein
MLLILENHQRKHFTKSDSAYISNGHFILTDENKIIKDVDFTDSMPVLAIFYCMDQR